MSRLVDRDRIVQALEDAGLHEGMLSPDYSGRAMYGATCIGITVENPGQALLFAAALGSSTDDWDWVGEARFDNMGLGMIWYWPGVKVEQ